MRVTYLFLESPFLGQNPGDTFSIRYQLTGMECSRIQIFDCAADKRIPRLLGLLNDIWKMLKFQYHEVGTVTGFSVNINRNCKSKSLHNGIIQSLVNLN